MSRLPRFAILVAIACTWSIRADAQIPDSTARRQQRALDSLVGVIRALQQRIDALERARPAVDTSGGGELAALRAAAAAASADSAALARPQQARLGQNALNPEISVSGDVRNNVFRPGPQIANFVPREFEIGFQSALDPFSTAKVFVSFEDGEASLEEGYAYFTALPFHMRVDVGQFRQQVGELNRWHLHALPEDEYPLVIRRFTGEEGLVGPGVSLYWPIPFSKLGAYEFVVQGTTGTDSVLYGPGLRPSVNAQLSGFWQINRSMFAQASASGLVANNSDSVYNTSLGVGQARFTWRPPQQAQARELTLRGEFWARHRNFRLPPPVVFESTRYGWFVDGSWKLNRRWTATTRYDWVETADPILRGHDWEITPSLTFWQSEFVFLRGVYTHARDFLGANRDRLTLQVVFAMGPHKHELF